MAPIQIILLIMTVTFASPELALGGTQRALESPWLLVLSVLGSYVSIVLIVGQRANAATRLLLNTTADANPIMFRIERLLSRARWATIALTAFFIYGLGWGVLVDHALSQRPVLGKVPMADHLFMLLPPLLAWVWMWVFLYRVERAVHDRSVPYRLAQHLPVHEMPTLGQYVLLQVRHNFYMLVPVVFATMLDRLLREVIGWYAPQYAGYAAVVSVVAMLVIVPMLIVAMWSTEPLVGDLRDRLAALARTYRIGYRKILIWRTHSHMTNAAILGYLPFARYFLLTDALLETLSDRQIEAVFAHEVGHGKKRHIWWYAASVIGWMMLAIAALGVVERLVPPQLPDWLGGVKFEQAASLALLALMAIFMGLIFPLISRRFEHQADWFAAQHMAKEAATEPLANLAPQVITIDQYTTGAHLVASTNPLAAGAEVFISALDRIVELSHRSRSRKGLMHPSINQRMDLLRRLADDEAARKKFDRMQLRVRLFIAVVFLAGAAGVVWQMLPQTQP